MEVKKANQQIIQTEIPQKSEVNKTKNAVQNLISDSFEKQNSQSSSSNSSSTASSEPERKAGQITGGILIKQMTAARLGGTNVNAAKQQDGKKELSPEQQSNVSNSDPQKKNLNSSFLSQDARSKDEDRKNSGLQPPFASNKGDASSKFTNVSRVGKDQVINATGSDQTSNAVKDANRFADGGSIRTQVDAEVAERHQDTNAIGGSTTDRLRDLLNPTAAGPQQSAKAGKDQVAYEQTRTKVNYETGSLTTYIDSEGSTKGGHASTIHEENTRNLDGTSKIVTKETSYPDDHTKVEQHTTTYFDADNNEILSEITKVTSKNDGTTVVFTANSSTNLDGSTTTTTEETTAKDGQLISNVTKESTTTKDGKTTTKTTTETNTTSGGTKSYDQENYTGNIPDAVKKTMEYFKQQVASQKPSSGGETAHTDDNAEADPTVGRGVSNLVAQQGNVGLFGNPGSRDAVDGGTTGGQGHLGSQSGGNVDFGSDSDQVGYNGITHEDDPGDVQFGSQSPVVKDAVESKNSDDENKDSNDLTDILDRKRRKSATN